MTHHEEECGHVAVSSHRAGRILGALLVALGLTAYT
jgi:hypothetical protein